MKKLLSTLLFLFVIAIISLSAQNRVYAPTLIDPENGDDGQMPDVILDWTAVGGSGGTVEYQIQLDITDAFTSPIVDETIEFSGYQTALLLFGQEYFWRVRAMEGSDVSDWSETFSFITFETVVLNKPNNNADEQNPNVEFKCKDRIGSALITGVEHYQFQADTSENFDSPLLFDGFSEIVKLHASFLHFGETYNWRARATHTSDQSAWSEIWAFTVIPTVALDEPGNGATDMGLANELTWDGISGVLDYTCQLADNAGFAGALSLILEEPTYTTDGFLSFGNEYFWRVRANHATDTSAWSEERNFVTINTVLLSFPEDEATDIVINPRLEWDMITGVDSFDVQYNYTPNFDDPCCTARIAGSDNFFQVIYNLEKGTPYYWRCRAMKGIDTTAWSEIWSFTVEEEIGINETAFNASNINIYPNPSNGKLFIDITAEETSEVNIYIMDLLGQIHIEETMMFGQGNSSKVFDLNELANGLYIVKLQNGEQSYSYKITVFK
ncbi:MAG: T9SS type A sorting domain-containing protein [Bacteroidales bacterium]|nr:T9SS type A sorting domain-containing protein [Bacteroidales bacterium]